LVTKIDEISKKIGDGALSEHEQIIKEQLESWIDDVNKKAELEQRLKKAFENSKSHVSSLSEI